VVETMPGHAEFLAKLAPPRVSEGQAPSAVCAA
jgi:hypothetical protein